MGEQWNLDGGQIPREHISLIFNRCDEMCEMALGLVVLKNT